MIIDETIEIIVKQPKIYKKLGYDVKSGELIKVKIIEISKGSHLLINFKCDYCGIVMKKEYRYLYGLKKHNCNDVRCIQTKIKETNLEKYGVSNVFELDIIKNKIRETNLEKYGYKHALQSDITKEKVKETNLEKYGVEHVFQSDVFLKKSKESNLEKYGFEYANSEDIRKKRRESNLEKYGFEYAIQSEKIKKIVKETNLERYNVENIFESYDIKTKIKNTNLKKYGKNTYTQSEDYHITTLLGSDINYIKYLDKNLSLFNCTNGHTFEISSDNYHSRIKYNIPLCTVCYPIGDQKSIKEKELLEYIKTIYSGEIISGYRDGLEIDIYLPELKLGFEFNGLYWHSNKFKENNYHLNKSEYFKEKGIRIIHIWEDDYINRLEIIKSQIGNLLGFSKKIFARKCYIKEVSTKESKKFLDDNHIQGSVSSKIKIGLYYNDELVSLMTFNSFEGRKKMEEGGYNLNRFCNKCGINVVGGASKLLSYFKKEYNPTRIVSYADKDWSIGDLYYKLGFTNVGGNGPDYKYIVDNQRVHKSRYRKSKLNTTLTEAKQMEKDGFLKIYDCGKLKFEIKKIH